MKKILNRVEQEIENRNIGEDELSDILSSFEPAKNRRIIAGYASVSIVDREGHRISIAALKDAASRFMKSGYPLLNVFHSDISVGKVLPRWTDPETGKIWESRVDDKGWFVVCELRSDIEIADKVWEEVVKGNLRSFSIAGSSKAKHQAYEGGQQFTSIDELDLAEITICLPGDQKVWTKSGLKDIKDIQIGEEVISHKAKWRKVTKKFERLISEKIIKITTSKGSVIITKNHPVRTLIYGGQNIGTHYEWKEAGFLNEGDLISLLSFRGVCPRCGSPIFMTKGNRNRDYCSLKCRYTIGNRRGKTYASGDKGALKRKKKMEEFYSFEENRKKMGAGGRSTWNIRKNNPEKLKEWFMRFRSKDNSNHFVSGENHKKTKPERELEIILKELGLSEWKFTGDGSYPIAGKFPDFYDGDKKIIEVFGGYWHKKEEEQERIEHFRKHGYDCIILWDHQFGDKASIRDTVSQFSRNKLYKILKIEEMEYSGLVYNLEVEEDNSFCTNICLVHNCETPVNQMSKFDILWNPGRVDVF